MPASEVEVEAAAEVIWLRTSGLSSDECIEIARAALAAADRVRFAELADVSPDRLREHLVPLLRAYSRAPYADASSGTVRVRAVLLEAAANEIERAAPGPPQRYPWPATTPHVQKLWDAAAAAGQAYDSAWLAGLARLAIERPGVSPWGGTVPGYTSVVYNGPPYSPPYLPQSQDTCEHRRASGQMTAGLNGSWSWSCPDCGLTRSSKRGAAQAAAEVEVS